MKVIVQIPCLNEEATLATTIAAIPRVIPGVDQVEVLVIDDGSTDRTATVARCAGADHLIRNRRNIGLARSFRRGLDTCLALGADIIVNTDGDNQYCGADIPQLIAPILRGEADMVIGDRRTAQIAHFSPLKKMLQRLGSYVVRRLAGLHVIDTVSGFRAFDRDAAIRLNIVSSFSYTIETVIQAGKRQLAVATVAVRTNEPQRPSRLFRNIPHFILHSLVTMIRMYAMYQPLKVFFFIGSGLIITGLIPVTRFLWFYFEQQGAGHMQSLQLGSALIIVGLVTYLVGLVTDLISFNRQLLEMTLERVKRLELGVLGRRADDARAAQNTGVDQSIDVH
jgi:glycosyltransferase involved in cell wall biosynthesis